MDGMKLQTIAFKVFYEELVCKATPNTVDFVRSCIDQQLIGTTRKTIREKCLEKINEWFKSQPDDDVDHPQYQKGSQLKGQLPDISVMLDCILDSSFLNLGLDIPFPSFQSFSSLLSVISRRCPQLEKLHIRFKHIGTGKNQAMSPITKPVVIPLTPLLCLTTLRLSGVRRAHHHNDEPDYEFIFSIVGKCFPVLSKLFLGNLHLRKMEVLKLIVKEELVGIIFARPFQDKEGWSADSVLVSLRIPTEYLNPICFTLEEMETNGICDGTHSRRCGHSSREDESGAPLAFALRHLTRLHSVQMINVNDWYDWTAEIIRSIYKATRNETRQADFEKACREALLSTSESASSTLLPNDFVLLITHLNLGLDALDGEDGMRAIASTCPHLESIYLNGLDCWLFESEMVSPDKLSEILKDWPKLLRISLQTTPEFIQLALFNQFATSLEELELQYCDDGIDLTLLSSATHLKRLVIDDSPLKPGVTPHASWNSANYLPNLEEFSTIQLCLETWAPLFEGKRTLKKLKLCCCHIGTKGSQLEWNGLLPDLWSQMESFSLSNRCTGLTMAMVAELFPKLSQLRSIKLPVSMMNREPEVTKQLTRKLSQKEEPIEIKPVNHLNCYGSCLFQ